VAGISERQADPRAGFAYDRPERAVESLRLNGSGLSVHTEDQLRNLIESLPAAVYATDACGRITFFNEAAAALWGRRPELGEEWWCGSWRLYWPDGRPMAHDECPMATTLKTGRPVRGAEAVAERPDGTRIPFIPFPTPLHDTSGSLIGAVNMLVDIGDRKRTEEAEYRLVAIVESSDDAIVSKDLNGIIASWNKGAERIFGYTAEEVIGKPVTILIPADRQDEELQILERIRRGERIEHFETMRQHKDGHPIDISLTVSPVKDERGKIIGASKIARDITDRRAAERRICEQAQRLELMLAEIKHRVKNTLGTVQAIAAQTFRQAPSDERDAFFARLRALAEAHDLLTDRNWDGASVGDVVQRALAPFQERHRARFRIAGPDAWLNASKSLLLAMALHELATNAVKYGALSNGSGGVSVAWELVDDGCGRRLTFIWREAGGPHVEPPQRKGFGSMLINRALVSEDGAARLDFAPEGVICTLDIKL
jgi:two-component system, chemotaxis family, CheB/CheR fusion protein